MASSVKIRTTTIGEKLGTIDKREILNQEHNKVTAT